ncbi:MAG: DUF4956 domain-containing protein [Clostridiales bacterium]|nr:DUF4956 domain-containing protein [Clostridiales bacterium]
MLNIADFIIYIAVALVLGIVIAASYMFKTKTSKSFAATLTLLPALVCVVIMMVNGSIGAGVAVAGTFSLVRFRSAQGTAKEITAIFLAMASGIICGMGYFLYAGIFTAIICAVMIILKAVGFGEGRDQKELYITIHEDLDYEGVFDSILDTYTREHQLLSVKTTDMGSLFRLKYAYTLKNNMSEKEFIDKLRVKNGNLPITVCVAQPADNPAQL